MPPPEAPPSKTPAWVWLASLAILGVLIYALFPKPSGNSPESSKQPTVSKRLKGLRAVRSNGSGATLNSGNPPKVYDVPVNQKRATDWHHAEHQTLTPYQSQQRLRVPPEPHGHLTDTEVTDVSQPVDWRVWKNWDNYYVRESMNPNTYGSFFFPSKTGYYTNQFIW